MAHVVRFIKHYLNWDKSSVEESWLTNGEIPADPLAGLITRDNSFSVYFIDDQDSALSRCIAAFAANRDNIQEIHYLIFDETHINDSGFKCDFLLGELPDPEVNNLHKNLSEISSQKLVQFATAIFSDCHPGSCDRLKVKDLIMSSLKNGWIDKGRLNRGMKRSLNLS
ncbi:MAG TPA: hypothetical protein DCL08_08920 [Anaerolineaceae bacterium]|jgi:hypothetical protein|nr:hypothetical protein [Anaerolineaceae bacterium]